MVYGANFMQYICRGYCESWILSSLLLLWTLAIKNHRNLMKHFKHMLFKNFCKVSMEDLWGLLLLVTYVTFSHFRLIGTHNDTVLSVVWLSVDWVFECCWVVLWTVTYMKSFGNLVLVKLYNVKYYKSKPTIIIFWFAYKIVI